MRQQNDTMRPRSSSLHPLLTVLLLLLAALLAAPELGAKGKRKEKRALEKARKEKIAQLTEDYHRWVKGVRVIMSDEELDLFLALEKDYQRDAYIERFWKIRDPVKRTARNEFKEEYEERMRVAEQYGYDERAEILLINGGPAERFTPNCEPLYWPIEVWFYAGSDTTGSEFVLLFYKVGGGGFRLWDPFVGMSTLIQIPNAASGNTIEEACRTYDDAEILRAALAYMTQAHGGEMGASIFLTRISTPPDPPEKEWVATFSTYTTDLPEGAKTFEARLDVDYPGRHTSRTVLQTAVEVPLSEITLGQLGPASAYNLMLNGEVLLGDKLFENFRYKYDFPSEETTGESVPLVFQRYLRPGEYRLIVKVEDINSGRFFRHEEALTVPKLEAPPPIEPDDPETARILAEANAAISTGENTIKIVPLPGDWQMGLVRIDTLVTGEGVERVAFIVDGEPVVTKNRAPFNVELDFGSTPRAMTLRVEAYDEEGQAVASDESLLNAGQHRFAVRLVEPRPDKIYTQSVRAQADVVVPEGDVLDRVEFYLNETLLSTVYHPPYIHPIILPDPSFVGYVRAVAVTQDGTSTENLVFLNAPDYLENVDVDFVELYTTVLDKEKHPVEGLELANFAVLEDEVAQEVVRFEMVRDLSIHAAVMLDVSASMEEELTDTQEAALHFFDEAISTKDRGALITFNDHPNLVTKFTNDYENLAAGLAGLKAERGTSLYDSLIFALYYFNGIRGQRAILLLSDGKDESSRFAWDDALDYARRAGVSIYTIGLKLKGSSGDARRKLSRLAEETGGRAFFIDDTSTLKSIYATIQQELRSRYLLAYQSNNVSGDKAFRTIEVKLDGSGLEAKTLRGYYP